MRECIVLVGLPGSGKTTYAKSLSAYTYIDGDSFNNDFKALLTACHLSNSSIVVDGLFLTNKIQNRFLTELQTHSVKFVYFQPNRNASLINDKARSRTLSSALSIKNMHIEKPITNLVYQKRTYMNTIGEYLVKLHNLEEHIASDRWCTGGTYGTCWDEDGPSDLSEEPPIGIHDFYELNKVLALIFPNLDQTTLNLEDFLSVFSEEDMDYYGGCGFYDYYEGCTASIIDYLYQHLYNIEDINLDSIKQSHPELLI